MNTSSNPLSTNKYPSNLFHAISAKKLEALPDTITNDMCAGLVYALSTLDECEYAAVRLYFMNERTIEAAAGELSVTEDAFFHLVENALRKLRLPGRWCYIRYGIAGYVRKRIAEEYRKGYHNGYWDGYSRGMEDQHNGNVQTDASNDFLDNPIEMLGLSPQALNCLRRLRITQVREVAALKESRISSLRNLGPKRASEIAKALRSYGIEHTAWNKYLL